MPPPLVEAVKGALRTQNYSFLHAPKEADAQLALLDAEGIVDIVLSSDSDLVVHGVRRLISHWKNGEPTCRVVLRHLLRQPGADLGWQSVLVGASTRGTYLMTLQLFAALAGCDYAKLPEVASGTACTVLEDPAVMASLCEEDADAAIVAATARLVQLRKLEEAGRDAAVSVIRRAMRAYAHAPAYSVREGRIVTLGSCPADICAALGFSLAELSASIGTVVGTAVSDAPARWEVVRAGDEYVDFLVPGMVAAGLPSAVGCHVPHWTVDEVLHSMRGATMKVMQEFMAQRPHSAWRALAVDPLRRTSPCVGVRGGGEEREGQENNLHQRTRRTTTNA